MPRLAPEFEKRARELMALYPRPRSALLPLCHLAQEQDGWLTEEAMEHIAELVEITPAEVLSVASFYDMFHTEPVGTYLIGICTNIACMLDGGEELLHHAEQRLGIKHGDTTQDGLFTIEEMECIAHCDKAPCLQVNYRYQDRVTNEAFDTLVEDLKAGRLKDTVPPHGTLIRVKRDGGLRVAPEQIATERKKVQDERDRVEAERKKAEELRLEAEAKIAAEREAAEQAATETAAEAAAAEVQRGDAEADQKAANDPATDHEDKTSEAGK